MRAYTIYWKNEQRQPETVLADAMERDYSGVSSTGPANFVFTQWQAGAQSTVIAFVKYEDVLRITSDPLPDEPLPVTRRK